MNLLEAIQGAGENWIRSLEDASYIFSINDGIIYSQIGIETIGIGFYRAEILTGEWEIVTPEQVLSERKL